MSGHDDMHDAPRDPHLREALRHAPDAQLQAPTALSELILKEARAKARDPQPAAVTATPAPAWAQRVWGWLARPAVATGFAGVMAAVLVGLMWWDEPMDEALPRSPLPAAAPRAEGAAASQAPAAPAVVPARPSADTTTAAPKPEPARKKAAEAPRAATQGTAAPARSDAAPPSPQQDTAAPAPVPPPAPAPATAAAPPPAFAEKAEALAKARAEEQKREVSGLAPAEAQERRAAARLQLNESRLQRESEAYTRVASVRAAIAAEPARWAWQRGSTAQPLTEALTAWLAQLDAVAGNRWQARQARDGAAPLGRELVLLRDGQVQHRFQLTEQGVLWDRGQSAWQVELQADALAALRGALDSATP